MNADKHRYKNHVNDVPDEKQFGKAGTARPTTNL
jgi:hypothetical protein